MSIKDHIPNWTTTTVDIPLYGTPNTSEKYWGKDNPEVSNFGMGGQNKRDVFTNHVEEDYNGTEEISYDFNSMGLRGPELSTETNRKILYGGGSLIFGTGVPLERTFPYLLSNQYIYPHSSYINVSHVDCLTDLIEPFEKFKDFDPDFVIVNDTRFFQPYGYVLAELLQTRAIENNEKYKIFKECDKNTLLLFSAFLRATFPRARKVITHCHRRAWKDLPDLGKDITVIRIDKSDVVDIARDNAHPGIISHRKIAEKIFLKIGGLIHQ